MPSSVARAVRLSFGRINSCNFAHSSTRCSGFNAFRSAVTAQAQVPDVAELQQQLSERDQTIQQLRNRLLEQNALTNQVNSQRIRRIEKLLLRQNEQLGELPKRLPEPGEAPVVLAEPEQVKKGFWQPVFGK